MTYDQALVGASIASLLICFTVFLGALWYAFRPGTRARFERAARLPLED
jgi:cbb3-type cytochrome oxidase subunit 3